MNEIFEKIYNDNNTDLNESSALFEKVYTEAEMLNEMNPKLRALLAAGLIGTAGLGAASCSMPTDDPYDAQYTIEQPTPENPEEIEEIEDSENPEEITDSEDSEDFEDPEDSENPEEIEEIEDSENPVTFETLGVSDEDAKSLSRAIKVNNKFNMVPLTEGDTIYIYRNGHFEEASSKDDDKYDDASEHKDVIYICYIDLLTSKLFYVPEDMGSKFDQAITVY